MKLKVYFVIFLYLTIQFAHAQIGIGTTTPNATLDIQASNQSTPANTDGILVPRIDAFPTTNPTGSQNGMLVFLTTVAGTNQPGFYYWNNATTSWVGINSSANSDADWYKVGTTSAPTLITDNMFHTGNVAIGQNTANYPLEVTSANQEIGINSTYTNDTDNGISNIGINNQLSGTTTDMTYGMINTLAGSGSAGSQVGVANTISNSGNGQHQGTFNILSGTGTGNHYGVVTELSGVGTGEQFGEYTSITNSGNSNHFGNYIDLLGNGNGSQFGNSINIGNAGTGLHYGTYTNLSGSGSGLKYGHYNYINPAAGGTHYGIYSEVLKPGSNYAGYFLGNVSIGTTSLNNYVLPATRGTNGQIMQTDGSGNVSWQSLNGSAWQTSGNSGTSPLTNFIGTTDNQDIVFKRNGIRAGYIGDPTYDAGFNFNNGNTAFGANSLLNPIINFASQFGVRNTAFGANALTAITTGQRNTGIGEFALFSNTTGTENTAIGSGSLYSNVSGQFNVAIGRNTMTTNNASFNTAVGFAALRQNISGTNNVAVGYEALRNITGTGNVGIGFQAGRAETGSNKLYIENSNADANNALIYGEFDTNIVRVNGQIQVSNPATTGYALPTTRGTNLQVLQTNGAGATSWVNPSSLAITETDPQVTSVTTNAVPKWNGTTLVDGVAVDDGTNLGIGMTPLAGNKLDINGKTRTTNFQMTAGAAANALLQSDASGNASWVVPASLSLTRTNLSSNQALTTAGWQRINFNSIVFDVNSEFNTGTNRFVALKAGYYEINAGFHTDNQSNTQFYSIGVFRNGVLYQQTSANHSNLGAVARNISCIVYLNVNDYVEIFAENYQSGVSVDSFSGKTFFEIRQIR